MAKNRPIQIMIVLAVFSLVGIIGVQVYWVSQAVSEEEETFDHNVRMSLRGVADNMCQIDGNELINSKPIDRVARNYFIARLQYNIDVKILDSLISAQFDGRDIRQDYEYGVYNCETDQMVFGNEVSQSNRNNKIKLPKLKTDEYYFGVYFPNKTAGLLSEMNIWKFMTIGTIAMLIFFGYGLVVVLKQRRLSEIQKDFIDNITHELKTPLATLRLTSDALVKNPNSDKSPTYADIISQETNRLEQHVDQILTSSLIDDNGSVTFEDVDVSEIITMIADQFKTAYPDIKWDVKTVNVSSLRTNRNCLEIALCNLIDNAAKYGRGEVGILARLDSNQLIIEVIDNGPGIPKSYQKKVFDKFFRIPTDNIHDVKGYGLGMYLVKVNLKSISGKVSYSNKSLSTFTIKLPAK